MDSRRVFLLMFIAVSMLWGMESTLNIQGVLRDNDGNAVADGNYSLEFIIYDTETGGSPLWSENQSSVLVKNGIYSVQLGKEVSLSDLTFTTPYYVSISVNGGEESSPRIPLSAAPAALAVSGSVNTFPSDGTVNIGSSDDQESIQLSVNGIIKGQASANSGDVLFVGNDSKLTDVNQVNTLGVYGLQNEANGGIELGSSGPKLYGSNKKLGLNTTSPDASLHVGGSIADASLTGGGAVVIGDVNGANISIDNNEIMARNNGSSSELYINHEGGTTDFGGPVKISGGSPIVFRSYYCGEHWSIDHDTGVSSADWSAAIVGSDFGYSDWAEDGSGWIFKQMMVPVNGTWHIRARVRTHQNAPDWEFHVMFVSRKMASEERAHWGWWD